MISMTSARLDLTQAGLALAAFEELLANNDELDETGAGGLQEFFTAHPNLLLLMGRAFGSSLLPAAYLAECSILQEFRADYAVTNSDHSRYLFVELEGAKRNSIFCSKTITKGHRSFQWSAAFERGFSQVVDWYFRLDDYRSTSKMEEHFGAAKIDYVGILVIGRDKYVNEAGLAQRFEWRRKYTVINSQPLHCLTFDELAKELRGHHFALLELSGAGV